MCLSGLCVLCQNSLKHPKEHIEQMSNRLLLLLQLSQDVLQHLDREYVCRSSTKYCTAASIVPDLHPQHLSPSDPTNMCKCTIFGAATVQCASDRIAARTSSEHSGAFRVSIFCTFPCIPLSMRLEHSLFFCPSARGPLTQLPAHPPSPVRRSHCTAAPHV